MTSYRVLIVDDSRFMRQVLSDMVSREGSFTVAATASDGEEAVRLVEQLKPDIVTMDMEMPRMNGLEALQRIMASRPMPVIMLSAVTDNGTRDTIKALQYGAFDFVRKPDSTVNLDIREVSRYLLEKLRIAAESLRQGTLRMLPAVRDEEGARPTIALPLPDAREELPEAAAKPPPQQADPASAKAEAPPKPKPGPAIPGGHAGGAADRSAPVAGPAPPPVRKPPPAVAETAVRPAPAPVRPPADGANKKQTPAKQKAERPPAPAAPSKPPAKPKARPPLSFHQIVAIGTSTGGPRALHEVLTKLPADFEAPVLVVQHMPPKFTHSLAQRLDSFCEVRVREAVQGEPLEPGTVYVAPGGNQMTVARDAAGSYRIKLSKEGPRNGHMPSVDVLFESLLGHRNLKRHAVLMTGMGSDGAKGMKALQGDGVSTLIAESEETCVVYGMPRSAVELGAVSKVLPLGQIGSAIVREVKASGK